MDMQSQMRRPYGDDQAEDPIRIHHPEEEEHQEKGATKVLKKVKEKAKKIKNSLTKHGHDHDDVDEEDDKYNEQEPEVHGAPVYESSAKRGGVTGQPESLSHTGETNVPATEEIIPPGTKVFPVVSSDYTRPVEPEPLRDTVYGHEALSDPVRRTDGEEKRGEYSHPLRDMSEREESREAHQMPMSTPASLLSATEDVTRTFAPGEDEYLGGQRKVNIERPKGLEEDPAPPGGGSSYLSGVSNYQSKVTDPTQQGGGEAGVPEIAESLGRMKVTDESPDQKSGLGFESDLQTKSQGYGLKKESDFGKDSPAGFGGESRAGIVIGKDFPARGHEFDQKNDSGVHKDSPTGLGSASIAGLGEESGIGKESSTGFGGESGPGLEKDLPARNDDAKVETELGRDLPTGSHDQFSPELSPPEERDDFDSKAEGTRDEAKPSTYTEKLGSATSFVTDKAIAAKNAVASKLGYSGGGGVQQQSPVGDDETTPRSATGYGQKVAGTVAEKLTPVYEKVKETGSTVMTKLPLSGGGSVAEEKQQGVDKGVSTRDYFAEKLRPGEEDRALSEVIAEKLHLGGGEKKMTTTKEVEVTVEKIPSDQVPVEKIPSHQILEEKEHGQGMVGKLKGAVTSWLGGTTEELKPKSSDSVDESSQSLGSTVGTTGFSDSGGAVPAGVRGLQDSGH